MDFISQIIGEVIESVVEEEWRPIVGYEGLYEVSNLGRVKGLKRGKILKCEITRDGYVRATLCKKNVENRFSVHRLVLQTFQPTEEELDCDHVNFIKNDNRLVNLRWATSSQNTRFQNKREGCSSQHIGVYKTTRGKPWRAMCRIDGVKVHLGTFDTEEEAGRAYNNFVISKGLQDFVNLNKL
jgi:hypothetical protein